MTLLVPLLLTLIAELVLAVAAGDQLVELMARVGVELPVALRTTSSMYAPVAVTLASLLK